MSVSPLRHRMIGDMTARHIGENTQKNYIRCVKNLPAFIGRPPETATPEDLRLYRLHPLIASGGSEFAGWGLHTLESAALSRRTPATDLH